MRRALAITAVALVAAAAPAAGAAPLDREDRLARQLVKERAANEKLRAALVGARSKPAYVWWSTGSTRAAVEAVFDERQVPESSRARWRCIFSRESGWQSDVWYSGDHPNGGRYRGWLDGKFSGTDRVNGVAQLKPFWAWWWKAGAKGPAPRRDASLATYRITSDPVTSTRIALRIGFGPFFAQDGNC